MKYQTLFYASLIVCFMVSLYVNAVGINEIGLKPRLDTLVCSNAPSIKGYEGDWEILFDGGDPGIKWRSVDGDGFPTEGWTVKDSVLMLLASQMAPDLITREQFSDFELMLEYKLADSANTGIKYFVTQYTNEQGKIVFNGPEYQLIDDFRHETVINNKSHKTSTGALYLLYAPHDKHLNPSREWNHVRIVAIGKHVEHWLNGRKILSYERGSGEFRSLVANSKFKEYAYYGEAAKGHLLLQHHQDQACFKHIKVRRLSNSAL